MVMIFTASWFSPLQLASGALTLALNLCILESVSSIFLRGPQSHMRQNDAVATVLSGIDLEFYCIRRGQGTIFWTVDNRSIAENGTFSLRFGGVQLRVLSVTEKNSGMYRCLNKKGDVLGQIKLVIEKVPELNAVRSEVRAVEGSRATLGCHCSSSYSSVQWLWKKNSSSPSNLKGFTSERKNNGLLRLLHISNVEVDHETTYVCESWAFNRGHAFAEVHLEVIVPATIIGKPLNLERAAGEDAQFSCQAEGKPEPQITWHKYPGKQIMSHSGGSLILKKVGKGAEGTYVCNVTNYSGMYVTASAQLLVKEPNRHPSAATIGGSIILECHYKRQLHAASITWFKNSQDVETLHDKRIEQKYFQGLHLGQITIRNATWQDAAEYTCTVRSNTSHEVILTKQYDVKIYGPPLPPLNLRADVQCSMKQVLVQWRSPNPLETRPVTKYNVSVTLYDKLTRNVTFSDTLTSQGKSTSLRITKLCEEPCNSFLAIDIQAVNTYGRSPFIRMFKLNCPFYNNTAESLKATFVFSKRASRPCKKTKPNFDNSILSVFAAHAKYGLTAVTSSSTLSPTRSYCPKKLFFGFLLTPKSVTLFSTFETIKEIEQQKSALAEKKHIRVMKQKFVFLSNSFKIELEQILRVRL